MEVLMVIRQATVADIPALNQLLQEILLVHHEARPDIFRSTVWAIQTETKRKYTGGISLSLPNPCYGVSVNVAYAHHDNNRNVPDECI